MIDLLITLIILAVVFGLIYWLIQMLPLPDPFAQIVRVGVIVVCILVLLSVVFGGVQLPVLNLRR